MFGVRGSPGVLVHPDLVSDEPLHIVGERVRGFDERVVAGLGEIGDLEIDLDALALAHLGEPVPALPEANILHQFTNGKSETGRTSHVQRGKMVRCRGFEPLTPTVSR